jgi:hypothetical protein
MACGHLSKELRGHYATEGGKEFSKTSDGHLCDQ